jgi:protein-S-isoprenylcysteine O-methyltransferase Ste14
MTPTTLRSLPPSATGAAITLTAYGLTVCGALVLPHYIDSPVLLGLICLSLTAGALILGDILVLGVHRRPDAGLGAARTFDGVRITIKLVGFAATLAIVAIAYRLLLPLAPKRFGVVLDLLPMGFALTILIAPVYFVLIDRRMEKPEDGYWETGQLVLGRIRGRDWNVLRTHALGWIIKAFFLPVMASSFFMVATNLTHNLAGAPRWDTVSTFRLGFDLILLVDLTVAVLGYIFTLRLLDSHIRSCNPLWYGWVATLICYYPFWGIVYPSLLGYSDGRDWTNWLAGMPVVLIAWGSVILAAKIFWMWSNVTFGLRFSNLTHRGILTNGPFRFTKHPSYISKNIAWWMISLPFLSTVGWQEALLNCVALLFVNAIYVVRAKIEERHLMEDPVYVAYAAWIAEHGLLARAGRFLAGAIPNTASRSG